MKKKIILLGFLILVSIVNSSQATELQKELLSNISEENLIFKIIRNVAGIPDCIAMNIELVDSSRKPALSHKTKIWKTEIKVLQVDADIWKTERLMTQNNNVIYNDNDNSNNCADFIKRKIIKRKILIEIQDNPHKIENFNKFKNYYEHSYQCEFTNKDCQKLFEYSRLLTEYNKFHNQYEQINLSKLNFEKNGEIFDMDTIANFMDCEKEYLLDFAFFGFQDEINTINTTNDIDFTYFL